MQNWLFGKLTDDEMDSAYVWFEPLEPELGEVLLKMNAQLNLNNWAFKTPFV